MAFTATAVPDGLDVFGRNKVTFRDFKIPNPDAYTAGGYVINASDVGLKFFRGVVVAGGDVSLGTYFPMFDLGTTPAGVLPTTGKLRFFTASGTEATGTISPTINIRLMFIGG